MPRKSRRVFPEGTNAPHDNLSQQDISEAATKALTDASGKSSNAVKTAVYARLSVEDDETMDSIETQIELVKDYIAKNDDLLYVDTYFDNGFTGTNFNRPGFNRMMDDLRSGKIGCVAVKDLSRFGRNYLEAGYYLETIFPFIGARLISVTDNYDTAAPGASDDMIIPIKNMVNAMYSKDLSKKLWSTMQKRKKDGAVLGNRYVYGYVINPVTERYDIDPEMARYVQLIFQWRLNGLSIRQIKERLDLLGVPTPRQRMQYLGMLKKEPSKEWNTSTIGNILGNVIYIGHTANNKTSTRKYAGQERIELDPSEWIITKYTHPAIIAEDDFDKVQEMIRLAAEKSQRRMNLCAEINARYPDRLKDLLYCGDCGKKMKMDRLPHGNECEVKTVIYECHGDDEKNCMGHRIPDKLIQTLIMNQIRALIKKHCDMKLVWEKLLLGQDDDNILNKVDSEIRAASAKLNEVTSKRTGLYESLANRIISSDEFAEFSENYKLQQKELSGQIEFLKEKKQRIADTLRRYFSSVESLEKHLEVTGFDEDLVRELVERVDLYSDNRIYISFKLQDVFDEMEELS